MVRHWGSTSKRRWRLWPRPNPNRRCFGATTGRDALYVHWLIEDGPAPELATLVALADLVNDLRRARKRTLVHLRGRHQPLQPVVRR